MAQGSKKSAKAKAPSKKDIRKQAEAELKRQKEKAKRELSKQKDRTKKAKADARQQAKKARERAKKELAKAKKVAEEQQKKAEKAARKTRHDAGTIVAAKVEEIKSDAATTVARKAPARRSVPTSTETVTSLRAKAKTQGIAGYSRMTKDQLLAKVK